MVFNIFGGQYNDGFRYSNSEGIYNLFHGFNFLYEIRNYTAISKINYDRAKGVCLPWQHEICGKIYCRLIIQLSNCVTNVTSTQV